MHVQDLHERKNRLRLLIEQEAFVRAENETVITTKGRLQEVGWLFDLRRILMRADCLDDVSVLFWNTFRSSLPFQIGGIETAAIPLTTSLIMHPSSEASGLSGFFIRKSRKKVGLTRLIEGVLIPGHKVILVDDIINSGESLLKQIKILEELGHEVAAVFVLMRFRDLDQYEFITKRNIRIESLFTLDDFEGSLGTKNVQRREASPVPPERFRVLWKFKGSHPSYHHVLPKSDPLLDSERLYVGSDTGTFYALNQQDGSIAWKYQIGLHQKGKGIFSSPALADNTVFFGGYDGNVYALDAKYGKKKWVFMEADWVGSSPAIATDLGLLFIGLEFGLWRKRGGIVAIDAESGKKVWGFYEMPCYTHSSPLYIQEHKEVVIGSNDGNAYLFNAQNGKLIWKCPTGQLTEVEVNTGFSRFDIKESFAYDPIRDCILFGNHAGLFLSVDRKSGKIVHSFQADFGFFSTPLLHKDTVIASSLDQHVYCLELDTLKERWRWNAHARIFTSPTLINDSVYIGANTGRLTELDPDNGAVRSSTLFTERVTNKTTYNPITKRFFVPTYANEIYCLEKII